ncbi:hypothetical protein [Brevundimonas sp.]|uniref:hypothetical protein n=1 Tax=Brevundimonas sp. TaxID=1871086 RepID=UPI003D1385C6
MALEREEVKQRLAEARGDLASKQARVAEFETWLREGSPRANGAAQQIGWARQEVENAQKEVDALILRDKRLDDSENERADAASLRRAEHREEQRQFWFRRFHLSVGLAHGAGLAAISSKVFDKDVSAATVSGAWWSLTAFVLGLLIAGLIPIALYFDRTRWAWWMASGSAAAFVWALCVVLAGAAVKAQHVWPFQ